MEGLQAEASGNLESAAEAYTASLPGAAAADAYRAAYVTLFLER